MHDLGSMLLHTALSISVNYADKYPNETWNPTYLASEMGIGVMNWQLIWGLIDKYPANGTWNPTDLISELGIDAIN